MTISSSQYDVWAKQGAVITAKSTHQSIRNALAGHKFPSGVTYDTYLQGSYKNSTNIRGDSDVDLVVQLDSSFRKDLRFLPQSQKEAYEGSYENSDFRWVDFRHEVQSALSSYYGTHMVNSGDKTLKVKPNSGRLPADVVVCIKYRVYHYFHTISDQGYTVGITFYDYGSKRWIVNYPKLHYDNGVAKNSDARTTGLFKPTVRMFKNARSWLVDEGHISETIAPSHFIESLVYNVPDACFKGSNELTFLTCLSWMVDVLGKPLYKELVLQHEQGKLIGTGLDQWDMGDAGKYVVSLLTQVIKK